MPLQEDNHNSGSSTPEPSVLIMQRDDIQKQLNWLSTKYDNFMVNNQASYYKLLTIKNEVDSLKVKYEKVHEDLLHQNLLDDTLHFEMMDGFLSFLSEANAALGTFEAGNTPQPSPQVAPTSQLQGFRLPEIPLPKFNGDFQNWLNFRSAFSSIVVENTSVEDKVKYQYLKQVLSGEALNRVANVPSGDFQLAWTLLTERYDNPMQIADTHVAAILSPPNLNAKSAASWRAFVDHEKLNIQALESLDLGIEVKDLLYMYIIISRFDASTLREWERFNSLKENTSLAHLWSFMENQHKVAQAVSFNCTSSAQNSQNSSSNHFSKSSNHVAKPFSQPQGNNKGFNFQKTTSCLYCKDATHNVFNCPSFRQLEPSARLEAVRAKQLCYNCMKPFDRNHHSCSGACKTCGKAHHTTLHGAHFGKNFATNNSIQLRNPSPALKRGSNSKAHINSVSISNAGEEFSSQKFIQSSAESSICSSALEATPSSSQVSLPSSTNAANHAVINAACSSSAEFNHSKSIVVMPTAEVRVVNAQGQTILCRALLDTGSDSCLISERLASCLALPPILKNNFIHTVSSNTTRSTVVHSVTVKSSDQIWSTTIDCLVVNKISLNLPPFDLDMSRFNIPANLNLADPHFHQSKEIDILLGASVFAAIMTCGQLTFDPSLPILQNTLLGWIVFGALQLSRPVPRSNHVHSNFISSMEISDQLEKFWKIEELSPISPPTPEAVKVENHYNENTVRCDDGRFMVSLPRKDNFSELGQSEFQAKKRFNSLEVKLSKHNDLKTQYTEFMREYQELGHMSPVDPPDSNEPVFYIPHHAVFKPDSTTTKLRVVFDASAKTNTGVSLNDLLFKGPTVQPDLFDIVLRFRIHKFAFTADIAKMYRQVLLNPKDRNFHRIFWREDPSLPLQQFCLNTITYGTGPASFLATRTLNKLAELESNSDSAVYQSIHRDFYVDDCISGGSTLEQAIYLAQELILTLNKGGFELRKFRSCAPELIESIPSHLVETSVITPVSDSDSGLTKALGLFWHSQLDKLSIDSSVSKDLHKTSFTKRELLSVIASIYDPLGLVSPVVVLPKILLQRLWLLKLGWDDKLPFELLVDWLSIFRQLPDISQISIPRCVLTNEPHAAIELHGFSDASSSAYGCCIYVRSIANKIQSRLLCSKSRLAPLKVLSIPKLELQAALLLARLINRAIKAFKILNVCISQVFLWSDSTIVCNWLRDLPDRKDVFVSVRVAEIQETTSQFTWNHVKSKNNPADIVSRGSVPTDLCKNELWWHGPTWLSKPTEHWDSFSSHFVVTNVANIALINNVKDSIFSNLFIRISNPVKLIRVVAYCLRFVHNARRIGNHLSGELSVPEIQEAEIHVIKAVQEESFGSELHCLRSKEDLDYRSKIQSLSPFIHKDGLLRVGGRLVHADVPFDFQHQILLPQKHKFTKALVINTHQSLCHAGVQATMASIRQRFWIPSTRRFVKSVLRKCIKCFRFTQSNAEQIMGQLPAVRVNVSSPFSNVGVDYMGPFNLRLGGPKSRTFSKAHIALFICMSTRAVHLEVVTELSTKSFLAALTRFVSIRGIPNSIHSDNGTAFVGANNELQDLYKFLTDLQTQDSLQKSAASWRIQWSFIPPRAPHFGGLWERSIKSFKNIFKVVTFKQTLNFEEMYTFSAQIGAILNSRPIVPLSEDPHDLAYLSPGHFLIGRPLNALPVKQLNTKHINHIERWRKISDMNRQLWERWSQEYLISLQKKHKWTSTSDNIKVGILVLLKDPGSPPAVWRLGRITEVVIGVDGKVRVVMVLTDSGIFKRAITSIAPLPLEETNDDNLI